MDKKKILKKSKGLNILKPLTPEKDPGIERSPSRKSKLKFSSPKIITIFIVGSGLVIGCYALMYFKNINNSHFYNETVCNDLMQNSDDIKNKQDDSITVQPESLNKYNSNLEIIKKCYAIKASIINARDFTKEVQELSDLLIGKNFFKKEILEQSLKLQLTDDFTIAILNKISYENYEEKIICEESIKCKIKTFLNSFWKVKKNSDVEAISNVNEKIKFSILLIKMHNYAEAYDILKYVNIDSNSFLEALNGLKVKAESFIILDSIINYVINND